VTTGERVLIALGVAAVGVGVVGVAALARKRSATGALGAAGGATPQRIGIMQDAIWDGVRNPQLRELALAVTGNDTRTVTVNKRTMTVQGAACPPRDGRCESDAVGRWVALNRAVAPALLPSGTDSPAALACALLSLNGITCRLRLAPSKTGQRVYSMAGIPKNRPTSWSAVDVDASTYRFGTEPALTGQSEDFDG